MDSVESIRDALFQYVKENTFKETETLKSDTLLFVEGIFDSMGFALLLDFLDERYGTLAEDEDLVEENFESIDSIIRFIQSKKA